MKFLKALTQKKLAKAVVCGLVVSGGMMVGMGQAFAATYISGAVTGKDFNGNPSLIGTTGVTVVVTDKGTGSDYNGEYIYGVCDPNKDSSVGVENGKVFIEGGAVKSLVYGGGSFNGTAIHNTVIIDGGTSTSEIKGGFSNDNNAEENTLNVNGGTVNSVRGGHSIVGNAIGNIVNITNGECTGVVYGGYSMNGNAVENVVNISGGKITRVRGGYSDRGQANGNIVNLIGEGGVLKNIIVGYIGGPVGGTEVDDIENTGSIEITGTVFGGGGSSEGNTLNVAGIGTKVGNIANFQNINFHVAQDMIGNSMLIISDAKNANTVLPEASGIKILAVGDVELKEGNKIILIDKQDTGKLFIGKEEAKVGKVEGIDATVIKSAVESNPAKVVVGGEGDNDLILTIGEAKNPGNDENKANIAKNMVETRAAGLAIVNEGVDFMVEHGMANAKAAVKEAAAAGDKGVTPFAAIGGGKMRYNSGSHIDSKSWHGAVGLAKEIGNMTIGFAVDHGKTSFDSYNDGGVTGSGDSKATGASVMAEIKKDSGVHYDGSIRAGRVKNDYSALTSYDQSSTYYGLSLGGGKEFKVSDKNVVDVYGRYFWTHTNSADTTDNIGTKLEFDAINSHRVRVGGRFTHDVNDISKLYAGLAWQHEFKGDTRATVGGFEAPAPSLKGNTGIMELGWKVNANKNLDLDLGATGYTGKQKGASLNLALNFKF